MTFYILVVTIICSFGGYHGISNIEIVSSPRNAAIYIYQDQPPSWDVEPDKKKYTLYEVCLEEGRVKEIPIPTIEFKYTKEAKK